LIVEDEARLTALKEFRARSDGKKPKTYALKQVNRPKGAVDGAIRPGITRVPMRQITIARHTFHPPR
jgi:hypothetical protein